MSGTGAASDVPDVLAPGLKAIFCGINPGRVSAAARAHFANPRNDFWRLLHDAGLTPRLMAPEEQFDLPRYGYGLTNAAYRTTPGSGDLRRGDFAGSAERLEALARDLEPGVIAFVGKEAYRGAFNERPELGLQKRKLGNDAPLRPPVHVAGERGRPVRRAAALVPSACSTSGLTTLYARPMGDRIGVSTRGLRRRSWLTASPTERIAARAIVFDPDDRILLVHFRPPHALGGWWATPGGALD